MEKWMRQEYVDWFIHSLAPGVIKNVYLFTGTFKNTIVADGTLRGPSYTKARGRADDFNKFMRFFGATSLTTLEVGSKPHVGNIWYETINGFPKEFALCEEETPGRYHVHSVIGTYLPKQELDERLQWYWDKYGWWSNKSVRHSAAVEYATKYVLKSDQWRYWVI